MKIRVLLSVCLACLLISLAPLESSAKNAAFESDLKFQKVFLNISTNKNTSAFWKSHTVVDKFGGAHVTFFTEVSIFYAYCSKNCQTAASWTVVTMAPAGSYANLAYPTVGVDSQGRPRMMWHDNPNYIYAECNSGCTNRSNWKTVVVPLNPDTWSRYPTDSRYFALDPQGRPRFISPYYEGITYAYCDSTCTTAANWHYSELDLGTNNTLYGAELVFNSSGQPRLIGSNDLVQLTYVQCDTNCASSSSWKTVKLADEVGQLSNKPTYALQVDAQGRPRVAYYKWLQNDTNLYYAWADSSYTNAASWKTDSLPLPPATDRTLDMALDSIGNPHIIYADNGFDLRYLRCYAACNTMNSEWWHQYVETSEDLDMTNPIPPTQGFIDLGWWIDGYPSLAMGPGDAPFISYFARNMQSYSSSTMNNAWGIRFAGGRVQGNKTYLPFIER